jgi:putative transposase
VSRSWFQEHKDGTLTARAARRQVVAALVRRLFKAYRGTTGRRGSPRTCTRPLESQHNIVATIMREHGLAARRKKKRRSTTRPGKGAGGPQS